MTDPMELVDRLDQRAVAARSENTATALGDAIHFEQAAACIRELVEWRPIETFDGFGHGRPALVAVPTKEGEWIVGEAWLRAEDEGETYHNGWWWAGTAPGNYHDSPICETNHDGPLWWRPLPTPPSKADRGGV